MKKHNSQKRASKIANKKNNSKGDIKSLGVSRTLSDAELAKFLPVEFRNNDVGLIK